MKNTKYCQFCHQDILATEYEEHLLKHTTKLADGQMTNHITEKEENRFQGNLEDIPTVYKHSLCGGGTVMPDYIVRSYLANPILYNGYTFCVTCGKYFSEKDFHWVDTGENLDEYMKSLKVKALKEGKITRFNYYKHLAKNWLIGLILGKSHE
jgi:hypothetical protein